MKKIVYLFALFFIVACASKKTTTSSSSTSSSTASTPATKEMAFAPISKKEISASNFKSSVQGFTFEDFSKGKSIYESSCDKCHTLKDPKEFSVAEWSHSVPEMVTKYKKKIGDMDSKSEQLILGYGVTVIEFK